MRSLFHSQRIRPALTLVVTAVLLVLPSLGITDYDQRMLTLIAAYGMVVIGFNITHGYAGELALGQAVIFGAAAYATGIVAVNYSSDIVLGLLVGAATAGVVGAVVGVPGVRLGGWALAMLSFFLVVLFPDVINYFEDITGGQTGLIGIPQATFLGTSLTGTDLYYVAVLLAVIWMLLMNSYVRSRHGHALRVLAESPVLARSLGMSVPRAKLVAYVIGAIPAGLAGAVYAYLQQFLVASAFNIDLLLIFLAASIIGGSHAIAGAFFGAALLQIGPMQFAALQQYSTLSYGLFMLLGALFLGGGVGPSLLRLGSWIAARRRARPQPDGQAPRRAAVQAAAHHVNLQDRRAAVARLDLAGEPLRVESVSKAFGGQHVLRGVSLTARPGQITAIIGPNGSGKTTLLNTVSGFITADSGTVTLGDVDITRMSAHAIARQGVARTFQNPIVPGGLTVSEVVSCARFVKPYVGPVSSTLRLPRYRRVDRESIDGANRSLEAVGLLAHASSTASSLPLGTRRLLEVARSLAGTPTSILLDEPASGLDEDAIGELADALVALREAGATIILIEHNFPLVLRIADHINVLATGEIVASGTPDEIRNNPVVLESYIGSSRAARTASADQIEAH
ncbi:ATP-binding cassette domain-containing protein [Streptomyces mirabilis]|uniref:branched-chain amino acid ABC transporter ATP-binding protein/permease n=1 Tax=Streptomyces mirabilis TaxID=68239 RepID=UPI00364F0B74